MDAANYDPMAALDMEKRTGIKHADIDDFLTKPLDDDTFARHRDTIMNTGALAARPYGIPSGNHSGSGGV